MGCFFQGTKGTPLVFGTWCPHFETNPFRLIRPPNRLPWAFFHHSQKRLGQYNYHDCPSGASSSFYWAPVPQLFCWESAFGTPPFGAPKRGSLHYTPEHCNLSMASSLSFGGQRHVSDGQNLSFKEPCQTFRAFPKRNVSLEQKWQKLQELPSRQPLS